MCLISSTRLAWIFEILFAIGCISHLITITIEYMKYQAAVNGALMTPLNQNYPRTSLCFDLIPVIRKSPPGPFFGEASTTKSSQNNNTIWDYFEQTPPTEDVLSGCLYRDPQSLAIKNESRGSDCLKYFNVTKYIMQGYVCYMFSVINHSPYTVTDVASSMSRRRLLFELVLNQPFDLGYRSLPILHYSEFPYDERAFAIDILPSKSEFETYKLGYDLFWLSRLPPPYETNCGNESMNECFYDCVNREYRKIGAIGRSGIADSAVNLTRSGVADRSNKTFYPSTVELCSNECTSDACEEELAVTLVSAPGVSEHKLTFKVESVSSPIHRIVYEVKMPLNEFFIYLASIFGIWFGSSVLGIINLRSRLRVHRSQRVFNYRLASQVYQATVLSFRVNSMLQQMNQILNRCPLSSTGADEPVAKGKLKFGGKRMKRLFCKRSTKICNLLYQVGIVGLFLFEIWVLFDQYFKYETRLSISYILDPSITLPKMDICMDLSEMLFSSTSTKYTEEDYDKLLRKGNEKAKTKNDRLTLSKIYKKILPVEEIIHGCRYRDRRDYLSYHDKLNCYQLFNVTRFYFNWHMCYQMNPVESDRKFSTQRTRRNLGSLYSIVVNPIFLKFYYLLFIVFYGHLPFLSSKYLDQAYKEPGQRLQILSFAMQIYELLPAPYDTNCKKRERGGHDCINHCMEVEGVKVGRLPVNEILPNEIDLPVVSYTDTSNNSFAYAWRNLEAFCEKKCARPNCKFDFTNTFVSHSYLSKEPIEFSVNIPTVPPIVSKANARIDLYEFLYQALCCISFWVGITISTFNPVELILSTRCSLLASRVKSQISTCLEAFVYLDSQIRFVTGFNSNERTKLKKRFVNSILAKRRKHDKVSVLSRLRSICFYITCITGCCFHLYNAATRYFEYPTVINTKTQAETDFKPFAMSICLRFVDLAHLNRSNKFLADDLSQIPVANMINWTPDASSIIKSCGYRVPRSKPSYMGHWSSVFADRMFIYESDPQKCGEVFNVTKYIMQEYICYKFTKVNSTVASDRTLNEPRMIYTISIEAFGSSGKMVPYLVHQHPSDSNIWASATFWSSMSDNIPQYIMTYSRFTFRTLPLPYNISAFNSMQFSRCSEKCLKHNLAPFQMVPSNQLIEEALNMTLIDIEDESNLINHQLIKNIKKQCSRQCKENRIDESNTSEQIVTQVKNAAGSGTDAIELYNKQTNSPVISVTFYPEMTTVEFILLMGNVFATWFGFSVLSLNPFALISTGPSDEDVILEENQQAISWIISQVQITNYALEMVKQCRGGLKNVFYSL